jgi:hypothetical protein
MSNTLQAIMLINDALSTINALQPLITTAMQEGREVTNEELAASSANLKQAIKSLGDKIDG